MVVSWPPCMLQHTIVAANVVATVCGDDDVVCSLHTGNSRRCWMIKLMNEWKETLNPCVSSLSNFDSFAQYHNNVTFQSIIFLQKKQRCSDYLRDPFYAYITVSIFIDIGHAIAENTRFFATFFSSRPKNVRSLLIWHNFVRVGDSWIKLGLRHSA